MLALLALVRTDPPLVPAPDQARSEVRRELLRPEYYDRSIVQRLLALLSRQVDRAVGSAADTPALVWFAVTVVVAALVVGVGLLASRARRTARGSSPAPGLLTDTRVSSSELRARAEGALAEGRHGDAVLDGFRALAVRQVERGRLDDTPGATAHEVARLLAGQLPARAADVERGAEVFDAVLYGDRTATRDQAVEVLALDDVTAGRR